MRADGVTIATGSRLAVATRRDHDVPVQSEASYVCDSCGEEIEVPIDVSAGSRQSYVEDCPVCCNPNVIHVTIDANGQASVHAIAEQDRA